MSDITSDAGAVDLSGATTSLVIDSVTLDASNFSGDGPAINLSGTSNLIFTGANTLNAGDSYALFPSPDIITGALPTVVGTTCFDTSLILISDNSHPRCYSGDIKTSDINNLTITESLRSLEGTIDLSNLSGSIYLTDAKLKADGFLGDGPAIDISGAISFICTNSIIDAGEGAKINLPPISQVTNTNCTFVGDINYAPEVSISTDGAMSYADDLSICTIVGILGIAGLMA